MKPSIAEGQDLPPLPLLLGIGLAFVVSVALIWLAAGTSLVAMAYGGALLTIVLTLLLASRLRPQDREETVSQPDWAVTAAAIENNRRAVAVIDRANRLTCANTTYKSWFGTGTAPQEIALAPDSAGELANSIRQAWREGFADLAG